jgi:hypothetical protein
LQRLPGTFGYRSESKIVGSEAMEPVVPVGINIAHIKQSTDHIHVTARPSK